MHTVGVFTAEVEGSTVVSRAVDSAAVQAPFAEAVASVVRSTDIAAATVMAAGIGAAWALGSVTIRGTVAISITRIIRTRIMDIPSARITDIRTLIATIHIPMHRYLDNDLSPAVARWKIEGAGVWLNCLGLADPTRHGLSRA